MTDGQLTIWRRVLITWRTGWISKHLLTHHHSHCTKWAARQHIMYSKNKHNKKRRPFQTYTVSKASTHQTCPGQQHLAKSWPRDSEGESYSKVSFGSSIFSCDWLVKHQPWHIPLFFAEVKFFLSKRTQWHPGVQGQLCMFSLSVWERKKDNDPGKRTFD